jgi:putative oxidoreductase
VGRTAKLSGQRVAPRYLQRSEFTGAICGGDCWWQNWSFQPGETTMTMSVESSASSYRDQALLVARILLGVLFLIAAYNKMTGLGGTTGYFGKLGVPAPNVMAVVVLIFELAVGILLLVGYQTRIAALAVAAFVIAAALIAHTNLADGNQLNHFLKNLAIAGGCLALFAAGPGAMSVDKR